MSGGLEFKWFKDQQEGIQLLSTLNARKANHLGLPNHDTERVVLRRARRRAARYEIESEGLGVYLKRRFARGKAQPDEKESSD